MKIAIIVGLISIFDCLRADKFGLSNLQCMISAVVKAQSVMDNILSKSGQSVLSLELSETISKTVDTYTQDRRKYCIYCLLDIKSIRRFTERSSV